MENDAALAAFAERGPIGMRTAEALRRRFGSLAAACGRDASALRPLLGPYRASLYGGASLARGRELLRTWREEGYAFLPYTAAAYPPDLLHADSPPAFLVLRGNGALLARPALGVIGTREPTKYGIGRVRWVLERAAGRGIVTIAGLAKGVDTAVHAQSLARGVPTIAVLPGGLAHITPRWNRPLADAIVRAGGLLLSEYAPRTPPIPSRFVARNRIVAALCRALVVIEAGVPSGTMSTVAFALKMGREIGALPGQADAAKSLGCNRLIRDGARMLAEDDDLEDLLSQVRRTELPHADLLRRLESPKALEELAIACECAPAQLADALTELELAGLVRRLATGEYELDAQALRAYR